MKVNYRSAVLLLLAGLTSAQAPVFAQGTSAGSDTRVQYYEFLGKDTATVAFASGSSTVEPGEQKNLTDVVTAVRNGAVIASAMVAGWADQDYPVNKGQSLSKAQRKLADARIAAVKKELEKVAVPKIETHTMAKQPTWLSKVFHTEDSVVKGEGKIKDANDQLTAELGKILKDKGGPGKVVVIIRRQGDRTAH